jgi:signal transduction histidine kinase/ligand-binding sensor domain-containing protein
MHFQILKTFFIQPTITFFIILIAGLGIRAQNVTFTRYPIEAGLSQSVVNCIFQDSKGYIWVGTQNGLNRFDGYNFEVFTNKPSDTGTISNNWIYSIDEDNDGNLWIGTKGGLNQFIRSEKRFRKITWRNGYTNNITDYIYDVRVSKKGMIIINTPPVLTIFDPGNWSFKHYISILPYDGSVKDNSIPLLEDKEGMIWIGSTMGLACFSPATGQFSYLFHSANDPGSLSSNNITALYDGNDGDIWIGTANGLNHFDKKNRSLEKFYHDSRDSSSLSNDFIRSVTGDPFGRIWIGTEGGGLNKAIWHKGGRMVMENFTQEQHGIGHNIVLALMVDRSENLWIGTLQGLGKTDLKPRKFNLYRTTGTATPVDLLGNVIASIYKDESGLLWVGNWGQGLNIINRRTGHVEHFSSQLKGNHYIPNDFVHVIFPDANKNIWIGTRDGILVFDNSTRSFIRLRRFFHNFSIPEFSNMRIYAIIRGRDHSYWIGTQNGLYRIGHEHGTTEVFTAGATESHRISGNQVFSIIEDREGLIWIATLNGLDVYNPKTNKLTHFRKNPDNANSLCDNFVTALCEDHNGNIWIGTNSYLNKFSKHDSTFVYYSNENGFPNNLIYQIEEDGRRNLWFATGGGLARFDAAIQKFRTYSVDEGLQSMEFNLRASYKSSDGEMFFGGMNGFNSFYPDSLKDNPFIPVIVFTSCYKTIKGEKVFLNVENAGEVVFNYNDPTFTIEFAALEFTNPEKNRYAYMLEGVSGEWIETGNRRFVPFSNLPPGKYTFKVKGSNNDGIWNESGPSLNIIIKPPWWRTTWAWAAYIVILASAILLYIRMRERKLVHERNLLEQKVHLRTLQIEIQNTQILQKNEELNDLNKTLTALNSTKDKFFSIIAHDLRNPFHTILGLSEIVIGNVGRENPEKIRKSVSDIRDAAKHTFDLLQNLLIWARSQTGSLDFQPAPFELSERISENIDLVKSQAEKKNIELSYMDAAPLTVNGDKRMIDTVLRNLLTNAIKFTQQHGRVTVIANEKDDHFEVQVQDTGIGIAESNIPKIFLLENKYSRKGTEMERGSGLGLVLCREFVEKHNGTIKVISEPGKGSSFIFTLPK